MKLRIKPHRKARAAGSVMEIWATGNYIEFMPKGIPQQRVGRNWQNVGLQLSKSIKTIKTYE